MRVDAPGKRARIRSAVLGLAVALGVCDAPREHVLADAHLNGVLQWYIADLKTSFPEHPMYSARSAMTEQNYAALLEALKTQGRFNGVRLPIFPRTLRAADYPAVYGKIIARARELGLAIYASPMSVGMNDYEGWSDEQYADWLADYANTFQPNFLSPFNEPGIPSSREADIVSALRPRLKSKMALVGPGRQHVAATLKEVTQDRAFAGMFDIVDSHNANRDKSATYDNWRALVEAGAGPVWASEDPGDWSRNGQRGLPGVEEAVAAGVRGLVIWAAIPAMIDPVAGLTDKGREFATRLAR